MMEYKRSNYEGKIKFGISRFDCNDDTFIMYLVLSLSDKGFEKIVPIIQ